MRTALLADPFVKEHNPGPGHPEQVARFDAAIRGLGEAKLTPVAPRAATVDELALCHTRDYIQIAKRDVEMGLADLTTGDTQVNSRSYEVALRASGLCLDAIDLVMQGKAETAFCIVRPPGHHATPNRGMGFCLFNNVAVAARYAQKKYGVDRVAIADWDVHHGNGTQDIFYADPSVFFFSTHQSPWYPGTGAENETGEGKGKGTKVNCPFPSGAGRDQVLAVFHDKLAAAMTAYKPDLILISAGFDSRLGDPLGQFRLTDADFTDLTNIMLEIADKHAKGRVVSVLEGGYNLDGLTKGVSAHVRALRRETAIA